MMTREQHQHREIFTVRVCVSFEPQRLFSCKMYGHRKIEGLDAMSQFPN